MSWREKALQMRRFGPLALAFGTALLCAGCFQPMYGSHSALGGANVRNKLEAVEIVPIDTPNGTPIARVGVEVRNNLIFDFTGGDGGQAPTHKLAIHLADQRTQVIVDIQTARPDIENYGIDATYSLTDLATNRVVVTGRTFARVSYDIPGQQQRFARVRGLRDAEDRAAKVISDHITQRLASYFLAGT
jgi:LPS-assembly lipoprotein